MTRSVISGVSSILFLVVPLLYVPLCDSLPLTMGTELKLPLCGGGKPDRVITQYFISQPARLHTRSSVTARLNSMRQMIAFVPFMLCVCARVCVFSCCSLTVASCRQLLNHPQLSDVISDEDEAIFQSLQYIEVEEDEDVKSGFKIHFVCH